MGFFHSTNSRFTYEEEEEVDESAVYPNLHSRGYRSYGEYSLPVLSFTSIYNATKGLLQKLCLVINFFRPRTSAKDPLLPIQDEGSKQPLLVPSPLLSSPTADSILEKTFQSLIDSSCINDDCVVSCSHGEIREEESEDQDDVEVKNIVAVTTHVNDDSHVSCSQDRDISVDQEDVGVQEVKNIVVAVTTHVNDDFQDREITVDQEDVGVQEVKNIVVAVTTHVNNEERKIEHYSSRDKILLVGEGDFSFSACLAVAFGDATNIIATSLNTKAFLKKHYGKAMSNIAELRSRGGKVMHGIDATDMANHESLKHLKFHRIIYNFPYAGLFHKMSAECQLRLHRRLVSKFLRNAKAMLSERGEIHVSHKTNGFHAEFKLESIASSHGLRLIEAVEFNREYHYPGYNTKYGFGGDDNFDCNPSKTFKFCLKTAPL